MMIEVKKVVSAKDADDGLPKAASATPRDQHYDLAGVRVLMRK